MIDYFPYFYEYYPFSFTLVGAFHLYSDEKDVENKTGISAE